MFYSRCVHPSAEASKENRRFALEAAGVGCGLRGTVGRGGTAAEGFLLLKGF